MKFIPDDNIPSQTSVLESRMIRKGQVRFGGGSVEKYRPCINGRQLATFLPNLQQETRKGKIQRAREGLWNGNPPFGYCRGLCSQCEEVNGPNYCPNVGNPNLGDGKHLLPHPIESEVVRLAFNWYANGQGSDSGIAVLLNEYPLNENGLRPRTRGIPGRTLPGPFQKDSVRALLNNPFYTGVIPYYGKQLNGSRPDKTPQLFPGQHEAIVEPEKFAQVQEVRKMFTYSPRKRGSVVVRDYLLTGILRCGYCGRPMRGSCDGTGRKHYYRDATRIDRSGDCPQCTLKAPVIEAMFLDWLRKTLDNQQVVQALESQQASMDQADARFERARDLYLAGQLSRSAYDLEKERQLNAKKHLLENAYSANIGDINAMRQAASMWDTLIPINRKRLFLLSAETVFVRDSVLLGVQPTSTLLPFTGNGFCCSCGPDEIRVRGA